MTKLNQQLPISVQTIHIGPVPVTSVAGEIDMMTDDVVMGELQDQLADAPDVLVIDLSKVEFMGSSGINVLIHGRAQASERGTRLVVVAPDDSFVDRVLTLAGVKQMFDLRADLESAVRAG
ncbi:MAG TPA: STAS domain-containing protein [Lentzea sp.]